MSGTHFDLLRHGATGQHGFRGRLDDPLTASGWRALEAAAADHAWDAVATSPLRRCADFARELAAARGIALRTEPGLREYDFGDWQGRALETLAREQGDALARFWADPLAHPPPGAEPLHAFRARVTATLDTLAAAWPARCILVLTHGGVIRLLRCLEAGLPWSAMSGLEVAHASLHALDWPLAPAPREVP